MKEKALYASYINIRNTELLAYWSRYNIQTVLNFGLIAAVLSLRNDSPFFSHKHIVALVGIVLSIVWILFILMGKKLLIKRWEYYIRELEKNFEEGIPRLFTSVQGQKRGIKKCWRNLNILAYIPPILCILFWFWILFIYDKFLPSMSLVQDIAIALLAGLVGFLLGR